MGICIYSPAVAFSGLGLIISVLFLTFWCCFYHWTFSQWTRLSTKYRRCGFSLSTQRCSDVQKLWLRIDVTRPCGRYSGKKQSRSPLYY